MTWNPDLVQELQELLLVGKLGDEEVERQLARLVERHREVAYSELIYLLSHLRFEPMEAAGHWRKIVELRREMQLRLESPIDLRVALVSYFLEVHRRLESPTFIEMKLFEEARELAYRDELTGLRNYRFFDEFLRREVSRGNRYRSQVSLVLIDIDDFKSYNDHLGHLAGNQALVGVADLITASLRDVDVAVRFGGEEFAVVAPETPKLGAQKLAQRIRDRVERQSFPGEERQPGGRLTVSLGVASYPGDADSAEDLVRRADQALYLGKASGKNQVRLYGDERRAFRRATLCLGGALHYGAQEAGLTTLNLSEGGVRFRTELSVPEGALIDLRLRLGGEGSEISVCARVVESSDAAGGGCEAAARFLDMYSRDRERLVARLLEEPSGG